MAKKKEEKKEEKISRKNIPTLELKTNRDIAMDFAQKVYERFNVLVKSIVLFGSTVKNKLIIGSDIDIIIVVDDASFKFDEKFVMWYREELAKIIQTNPYKKDLHINTVKISTWWEDLMKGDPTIINIIRYGEVLIDYGGFFSPMKMLLNDGKIKSTPEAIYQMINRIPAHILRSRLSEMSSIEGCYWAFVESSQALLIAIKVLPPSPEFIPELLQEHFVDKGLLKKKIVEDFIEVYELHKKIVHGEVKNIEGRVVDTFQEKAEDFFKKTVELLNKIL
ncbi:nucleotidyltransferase domain-containing protein [Candidatus Pacearchaeota archaeon]|nr:nucleotidyltransferase domain-containing protein [Candidatus Pacearchaeota archaeon]